MRETLKDINWHVYGLRLEDFDHIMRVNEGFAEQRRAYIAMRELEVRAASPELADDILDDEVPYLNLEIYYLWESCIVRMIGIFEGAIERQFLPDGRYRGYRRRIDALKASGFAFAHENAIEEWVTLRNAIAHSPSESFRPHMIEQTDAQECCTLLKTAYEALLVEQEKLAQG